MNKEAMWFPERGDIPAELEDWLRRVQADVSAHWTFLEFLALHGSHVSLTWSDDPDQWELMWISGGQRFVGQGIMALDATKALVRSIRNQYPK